jgi:hypothetical protein
MRPTVSAAFTATVRRMWEYAQVVVTTPPVANQQWPKKWATDEGKPWGAVLEKRGREGWELTGVVPLAPGNVFLAIFKRPTR